MICILLFNVVCGRWRLKMGFGTKYNEHGEEFQLYSGVLGEAKALFSSCIYDFSASLDGMSGAGWTELQQRLMRQEWDRLHIRREGHNIGKGGGATLSKTRILRGYEQ